MGASTRMYRGGKMRPARLDPQPPKPSIPWKGIMYLLMLIIILIIMLVIAMRSQAFYYYNYEMAFVLPSMII